MSPLNENGVPEKLFFKAETAKMIVENIQSGILANYVIAIVAKPVVQGIYYSLHLEYFTHLDFFYEFPNLGNSFSS